MMGVLTFLFLCSGLSSQVFAAAPVRDNDDPSGDTWNSGTWTYKKASSGFRGDYRYRTSNSTSAEYGWVLPTNNSPKVIYVYLNANLASNTRADYWGPERQRGICIDKEISFDLTCYFVQ
ncbi:TPA_asm: hypothetical protein GHO96_14695 [Listeria monocytogenes]|nr:hypothetical protein [Listeria monocytogenes]HAA8617139.1 hypothetical protein [Listeria monocytogenes]HAA8644015.1 hypothetical protein [Listeria monocytogenes]HAA9123014.1 hypothetical protein [Listeria monocytogenes]HAA9344540.1 hypothetical protein [Listeria monocytogenes]HDU6712187.1 hypothetical protein [Listeria monocytogenes]